MPKRPPKNRPSPAALPRARLPSRHRDPLTTLSKFCEFLALGLVAAALFLPYPNDLQHHNPSMTTFPTFPTFLKNASYIAVHTRAPWVTIAVLSTITAAVWYRTRQAIKRNPIISLAPLVFLLLLALHAGAQAYLQSQGNLQIETHVPLPPALNSAFNTLNLPAPSRNPPTAASSSPTAASSPATSPATQLFINSIPVTQSPHPLADAPRIQIDSIVRVTIREGTLAQWQLLFAGDFLFALPILFVWLLTLARRLAPPIAKS